MAMVNASTACNTYYSYGWDIQTGDWGCIAGKNINVDYNNVNKNLEITGEKIYYADLDVSGENSTNIEQKNGGHSGNINVNVFAIGEFNAKANGGHAFDTGHQYVSPSERGNNGESGGNGQSGGNITINTTYFGYRTNETDLLSRNIATYNMLQFGTISANGGHGGPGEESSGTNGTNSGNAGNSGNGGTIKITTKYITYLPEIFANGGDGGRGGTCKNWGCDAGNGTD